MLILDLLGIRFHVVVVFGLGKIIKRLERDIRHITDIRDITDHIKDITNITDITESIKYAIHIESRMFPRKPYTLNYSWGQQTVNIFATTCMN